MKSKNVVLAGSWLATTLISVVVLWKGGTTIWNYVFVGILLFMATGLSFSIGYTLEDKEEIKVARELSSISSKIEKIEAKIEKIEEAVEEIRRVLEE
ncbi:hypothetical protein [Thermococcus paralvinellae]|uniref:Uncharacterized protein n=1 Tax=Thermococcus paralvinellae TaxID=582419 RepID=W0I9Z1_9EURY|nr:hypothetical protein [Thermococcus paralvinellae]AHF81295.1 Hypothetical protein TES1_1920 [Thermococcus paralvinellae]